MNNLKTFLKEDEEIKLEISKSFRSWAVLMALQVVILLVMLYLMKDQTVILRSLVSLMYVGICSWLLALKKYNKRLITNKKIILLSYNSQQGAEYIYLSQIKSMDVSKHFTGIDLKIILYNNTIHHIYDVSSDKNYMAYIHNLIQNIDTQTSQETEANQPELIKGYVYEKLETHEDIHLTNILSTTTTIAEDQANEEAIAQTVKRIVEADQIEKATQEEMDKKTIDKLIEDSFIIPNPTPKHTSRISNDNLKKIA